MRVRPIFATGTAVAAGVLALGVASPASAACDAYSGTCTQVLPTTLTRPNTNPGTNPGTAVNPSTVVQSSNTPATLPFTGGELVLLSLAGAGAIAGGVALVVAGRRRAAGTAAA